MVSDTIVIVLMCVMTAQQPKEHHNSFRQLFEEADRKFDIEYKLDIEKIKRASKEAVIEAAIKTNDERNKVTRPIIDVKKLFQ